MSIRNRITRKRRRRLMSSSAMHLDKLACYGKSNCGPYVAEFRFQDETPGTPVTKPLQCTCLLDRNLAGVYQGAYEAYVYTMRTTTEELGCRDVHVVKCTAERRHGHRIPKYVARATLDCGEQGTYELQSLIRNNFIDAYRDLWIMISNKRSELAANTNERMKS